MRNPNINPLPFSPKSNIDKAIVQAISKETDETILDVFTKENHPYFDDEEREECTADYIVHTSELQNGLYVGKTEYFVWVTEGSVRVEFYGSYI